MNIFQSIRHQNPIIECLTNLVSANFQANGLIAVGASPIMSDSIDECHEIISKSQALSINLGTLNPYSLDMMILAGKLANDFKIPIVLDPVGAGFTQYRTDSTFELLDSFQTQVIRCNYGEFAALSGVKWHSKGVDAGSGDVESIKDEIMNAAKKYNCIFAVTGAEDIVASADECTVISGGHELSTQVTASGCLLSSICAATLASHPNHFQSIQATLALYKESASYAAKKSNQQLGQFKVEFINHLHQLSLRA